jgi:urea transport system substrate-binding protein
MLAANHAWPQKMFEYAQRMIVGRRTDSRQGLYYWKGKGLHAYDPADCCDQGESTAVRPKGRWLKLHPPGARPGAVNNTTVAFLGLAETDLPAFASKGQNMFVVVPFVATSDMPTVKAFVAKVRASLMPRSRTT